MLYFINRFKGGWWYNACHGSNLNGSPHEGKHDSYADGINWGKWMGNHYSLASASMMIKPSSVDRLVKLHDSNDNKLDN